jgi:hypothetical protein
MARKQDKWVRRTILAVGTLVFLISVFFPFWARRIFKKEIEKDWEEAARQTGIATVVMVVPAGHPDMGNPATELVTVRFHGKLYPAKSVIDLPKLHPDQPAQIVYRIGKSGRFYVDSVAPLPSTSDAIQNTPLHP